MKVGICEIILLKQQSPKWAILCSVYKPLGNPSVRFTQARKLNIARANWQGTITLLPEITLAGLELTWPGLFQRWITLSTG